MRTLTRAELTTALGARQMLLERRRLGPTQAIRQLTPLQGQDAPAPYIALAARVEGFSRESLEAAFNRRAVVKTTIMRATLHIAAASDYPFYAECSRQARLLNWRRQYAHLDEAAVVAELRTWLAEPHTNDEIRSRIRGYPGVGEDEWAPVRFARTLLPLVQVPPAGHWKNRSRPSFVADPRPPPEPAAAAAVVLTRYLAAFGPASRRDVAAWSGVAQREFAQALESVRTVSFRDERDVELFDLPRQPLPPASTRLPVRLLARWDQPLLAYADRERIIPRELLALKLTLSGEQTVTVDGRVAASWRLRRSRGSVAVLITPHVELPRSARGEIHAEARRTAWFCEPEATRVDVEGV